MDKREIEAIAAGACETCRYYDKCEADDSYIPPDDAACAQEIKK